MPDQDQSIVLVEDDAGMKKAIERLTSGWLSTGLLCIGGRAAADGGSGFCGLSGAGHSFTRPFGPGAWATSAWIGSRKTDHFHHRTG